ncbi:MAG: MYXO-CTERM sorting domain-containing protein [Polyangiaceae bacterium]
MTTLRIVGSCVGMLALALASAPARAADGWGASWSFGPTTSRIIRAKTTLVPGRLPPITASTGPLFIWPGMSNPTSDLIQTTLDLWNDNKGACGAATGQWCAEASVFGSFGQRSGPSVAIDPDDHVTIEYVLGTDNNTWTQTVTSMKLGKVVSTLQSASGQMPKGGFGFATEADADSYTIDNQYYLCTEIHLFEADAKFGSTGVGGVGAKYGATGTGSGPGTAKNLRTPDSGLTWLVDLITLPAMNPMGTQTPAPAINCTTGGSGGSGSGGAASGGAASGGAASGGAASGGAASGGRTSGGGTATGGASTGGRASGGAAAGGAASGGAASGGAASGGRAASGGTAGAGAGGTSAGGATSTAGGTSAGGAQGAGGTNGAGGASASGGTPIATGGTNSNSGSGGTPGAGGSSGGTTSSSSGGKASTAGSGGLPPSSDSGCGCAVPGQGGSAPRGAWALALGAVLALRRRRRNG